MTRKDYILLASALLSEKPAENAPTIQIKQWRNDCRRISLALSRDNPKFKPVRFLNACFCPVND